MGKNEERPGYIYVGARRGRRAEKRRVEEEGRREDREGRKGEGEGREKTGKGRNIWKDKEGTKEKGGK